jgi:hypothetical protein
MYCDVFVFRHVIIVGSGSDDWILLEPQLQPVLITVIPSDIAIPHIRQSLFTLMHRVYFQQSSSPTAYSLNTQLHWRHLQLALTITLWLTALRWSITHWYADCYSRTHSLVRFPHSHYTACTMIHSRNHTMLLNCTAWTTLVPILTQSAH